MKRKTIAQSAYCIRSSATAPTRQDTLTGLHALACMVAVVFALMFVFGFHAWSAPHTALADDTAQLTTSDEGEDTSEDAEGSGDSEGEDSEGSENPEDSEESEASDSSDASSSSGPSDGKDEGEEIPETGGLLLRVVDIEMAKKSGVEDGDLTGSQGDATLAGMKFNVYNEKGKLVKTMVADEDGLADLEEPDYLPLGTYTVKQVAESARSLGYKENSTWAGKGQKVTIEFAGDTADVGTCKCEIMRGAVLVNVVDADMYETLGVQNDAQGKATLAEAVFEVYNASSQPVLVGNKYYKPYNEWSDSNDRIMELTTNEWGEAATDDFTGVFDGNRGLPWGTYVIKQKEVSKGYHVDEEYQDDIWSGIVRVYGEDRFGLDEPIRQTVIRGGVKFKMIDADTEDGVAQGDATLKGATFEVINDNGEDGTIVVDGKAYAEGDVVLKLKTTKEGLATSAKDVLPYGTYKVRMANNKKYRSYAYDKDWEGTVNVKKNDKRAGIGKDKSFKAKVVRGGVTLKQLDKESNEPVTGTTIEIVNASKKPVVVKGVTYAKGKVVLTFSPNEEGVAKTARNVLPYGTYTLRESKAASGYDLNEDWTEKFQIRKAKKIVNIGKVYETASPVLLETESVNGGGKAGALLPVLGILAAAAAIAVAIVYRRRKQQEQELLEAALAGAGASAAVGEQATQPVEDLGAGQATQLVESLGVGQATQRVAGPNSGQATQRVAGPSSDQATQPVARSSSGQTTQILDPAYYASDAEATRALIDDQATRAMQATLASRAARERSSAQASEALGVETVAFAVVPPVPQVTEVMTPQDAEATLVMNAAHARQPLQLDETKDPTQPNYFAQALQSLEPDESKDPTQPNHYAEAIEAGQRTRSLLSVQDAQDMMQEQDDEQEFGTILPAVVTKSEQKRARRANRWGK